MDRRIHDSQLLSVPTSMPPSYSQSHINTVPLSSVQIQSEPPSYNVVVQHLSPNVFIKNEQTSKTKNNLRNKDEQKWKKNKYFSYINI